MIGLADELKEVGYGGELASATAILDETARTLAASARSRLVFDDVAAAVRGDIPAVAPTMLHRSDGAALIYPGLTHAIAGEPGFGKTWVALVAANETLAAGGTVMMLDYEGNRRIVGGRLKALGADPDAVEQRFWYLHPPVITAPERFELAQVAAERRPDLVVIDGVARAIARQGGDEDRAADVLAWMETVIAPFTAAGSAPLMLDHVKKDKDGRGRYARGSGSKLGEIEGVAYSIETVKPFSRTRPGEVHLRVGKDREGVVGCEGDIAAVVSFTPAADDRLAVRVDPPKGVAWECQQAVLRVLGELQRANQSHLLESLRRTGLHFRDVTVLDALDQLVAEDRVVKSVGSRGAKEYQLT